jgi:hypothetical protein
MRQRLYYRLRQLEAQSARMSSRQEWADREANRDQCRRRVESFLKLCGTEKTATESLMEAFARALEITCRELRQLLVAGVDPIRKYFNERGIYEEIESRKAAGTWPAAGGCSADVRL